MAAYEYVIEIRAGFNKLSNDMRQVSGQFSKLEKDIGGTFKAIGAIAKSAAVLGGIAALNNMTKAAVALAKEGEAAGSIRESFQALGGSAAAIEKASKATMGMVSSFELMRQANQALLRGVPDVNENFSKMADYASRVANALDMDTSTALKTLTSALAGAKKEMLEKMGVVVNTEAAYKSYAKANNIAAVAGKRLQDVLTDTDKELAIQAEALRVIDDRLKVLPKAQDSVTNAFTAMNTAIEDSRKRMGDAINETTQMQEAFRDYEEKIKSVDWESIGAGVGIVTGWFEKFKNALVSIPYGYIELVGKAFNAAFGSGTKANMDAIELRLRGINNEIARIQNTTKASGMFLNMIGAGDALVASLEKEKAELQKKMAWEVTTFIDKEARKTEALKKAEKERKDAAKAEQDKLRAEERAAEAARAAERRAEQLKQLKEKISDDAFKFEKDDIEEGIKKATESLDPAAFANYVEQLKAATYKGVLEGYEGLGELPAIEQEQAYKNATKAADESAESARASYADALKSANEEGARNAEQEYDRVADTVRSSFSKAFNDAASGDWQSQLMELAVNFAAALAAALQTGVTKNPSIITGLSDLGSLLGNSLADAFGAKGGVGVSGGGAGATISQTGSSLAGIAQAAGQTYTNAQGQTVTPGDAGGAGNSLGGGLSNIQTGGAAGNGTAGIIAGYAATAGTIIGAFQQKKNKKDNSVEGQQAGAVIGAVVGGIIGSIIPVIGTAIGAALGAVIGSMIGKLIGGLFKKGPQNPQTKARVAFEGWIEDQFKAAGNIRFFGAGGILEGYFGNFRGKELTKDFNPTKNADGTINPPAWGTNMDSWGKGAKGTFLGLGEALKEILKLSDAVGAQLGYMLGTNLSGNVDNARLLVQALGLDFEQVSDALLKAALKGQISWLQFNSYIRDTAEAFKPGLAAIGDIGAAFNNLIDSAGQGREAIKSFKDIAVEAMEAGVNTMEQLRQFLLAKGYDPEYVNALINSAAQRGIDSLKEWAEASDATAGAVVGDMEAASVKLQEAWAKMRESLAELAKGLKEIPKEVQSVVKVKVQTEFDDNTRELVSKLPGSTPPGIPSEGERNMEQTETASTGRSARRLAAMGRSLDVGTGNPFGGGSIQGPTITGTPYNVSAGGMNLVRNPGTSSSPGVSINIDAKNAGAGAEYRIAEAARMIEARVIANVIPMIRQASMRGGRGAEN